MIRCGAYGGGSVSIMAAFLLSFLVHMSPAPACAGELCAAIRSNDLERFAAVVTRQGTQAVAEVIANDVTPLHLAAALNRVAMTERLIALGANANARTTGGFTPLHWAAGRDAAECAKLLMDAGADINAKTPDGITPLHWAAGRNAVGVVKLLLSAGAEAEDATRSGLTPLHWALIKDSEDAAVLIAYQKVSEDVDRETTAAEEKDAETAAEVTAVVRKAEAESARKAAAEAPAEALEPLPQEPVGPRPVPGKALKVPLGFHEDLEFVWIESIKLWIGKYEVSNGAYRRYDPRHSSRFRENYTLDASDQPVVYVSWEDARKCAVWLNKNYGTRLPPGWKFRLPKDGEWEYVARCGDRRIYPWGNSWPPAYGNFADLAARRGLSDWSGIRGYDDGFPVTCPVTASGANEWGVYGMAGNVWEWCDDWYEGSKKYKVRRGGGWDFDKQESLRVDYRGFDRPDAKYDTIGFRLVVSDHD